MDCDRCGYRPRRQDTYFVEEYNVLHIRCYNCGKEWVE